MIRFIILLFTASCLYGCQIDEHEVVIPDQEEMLYFPAITGETWEEIDPDSLNWNREKLDQLDGFMEETSSRAIIILKHGRMAVEKYAGKGLLGNTFTRDNFWYWASAGKTLTAGLVGIAIQEGYLQMHKSSRTYMGKGWSSTTHLQEGKITVFHHLTMTSGLETDDINLDCTLPECLQYRTDPGKRWFYHNAPYTLLDNIISGATNQPFDDYFNQKLRDRIGMDGYWTYLDYNHVYFSTARSMARYGLLILNDGKWEEEMIINADYVKDMTHPSQNLNSSYGYLWWLNGQSSHILPGFDFKFDGPIIPSAPDDAFAGLGKNGQILLVVPSEQLVVVRLGDNPDNSLIPARFVHDFWDQINEIISD